MLTPINSREDEKKKKRGENCSSIQSDVLSLCLIDLLDLGTAGSGLGSTAAARRGTREASRHAARHTAHASHSTHASRHAARHSTSLSLLVEADEDGLDGALSLLELVLVLLLGGGLVGVEPLDGLLAAVLDLLLVLVRELGGKGLVAGAVASAVDEGLEVVLGLDTIAVLLIVLLVSLSVVDHTLDILLAETTLVVCDGDVVGLAGALLRGGDVHDAVSIDIEGNLDLGDTTRHGRDARELESAQTVVVGGHLTLTLKDLDEHTGLVVRVGAEHLGLAAGDGGVARDEGGHDTTGSLDTKGKRSDIEKKHVTSLGAGVASEDSSLDSCTIGNSLIGVDRAVGLLATEEVADHLLDAGDTSGTTDKDDLVDGRLVHLGVGQSTGERLHAGTEGGHAELLETSTGDGGDVVLTAKELLDLDRGRRRAGESALGTLAGSAETTDGTRRLVEVLASATTEVVRAELDEDVIDILTTKVGVTGSGLDLKDTVFDGKDRDIERASTKVKDGDVLLLGLLVKTVGNGSSSGLVDDTDDIETGDETSVLGGLTLAVVEVGRAGDDSLLDLLAEEGLGSLLHLEKDHGRDLLGLESLGLALVSDLHKGLVVTVDDLEGPVAHILLDGRVVETTADKTLGVKEGVLGVHRNLVLGSITDKTLGVGEGNIGGGSTVTLVVCNDLNTIILVDTNTRICGAKINTNSNWTAHGIDRKRKLKLKK